MHAGRTRKRRKEKGKKEKLQSEPKTRKEKKKEKKKSLRFAQPTRLIHPSIIEVHNSEVDPTTYLSPLFFPLGKEGKNKDPRQNV
jgi:hypothetical protein